MSRFMAETPKTKQNKKKTGYQVINIETYFMYTEDFIRKWRLKEIEKSMHFLLSLMRKGVFMAEHDLTEWI